MKAEKTHILKCESLYYPAIACGLKTFEVRKNDRGFKVNDIIILKEYCKIQKLYTGRSVKVVINYILNDFIGLKKDYVVLGIEIEK